MIFSQILGHHFLRILVWIHLSDFIRKKWDDGNYTAMVVLDLKKRLTRSITKLCLVN